MLARSRPIILHDNLTLTQVEILRSKSDHLLISGPAGTAKTYTALARGLTALLNKEVERIIIIRSAVPTRDIGFLPGSTEDKIEAYASPYAPLVDQLSPRMKYREFLSKKLIEFVSTSFLRGVTFDNAYVLIDEYQNMSAHELETAMTRVGEGTQLVLVGDSDQSDLSGKEAEAHHEVIDVYTKMDSVDMFQFHVDDIVRSAFVREYYEAKASIQKPPVHLWGQRA